MMHTIPGRRQTHLSETTANMVEYITAIERLLNRITEEYDDEAFSFPILGLDQMDEWIETMHGVLRDFATLRDKFAPHVMNEFPHVSQEVSRLRLSCVQKDNHIARQNRTEQANQCEHFTIGKVRGDSACQFALRCCSKPRPNDR